MKLYLLRHAEAHPNEEEDASRPLTEKGKNNVLALAKRFSGKKSLKLAEIRHSSRVRARETAELFAQGTSSSTEIREIPLLEPEDQVDTLAELLGEEAEPLLLVGHNPHLERLATRLLTGRSDIEPVVTLKKTSLTCLERSDWANEHRWKLLWSLPPKLI